MLPNYASAKQRMNAPDFHEATTFMQLCKKLVETAEACEVGKKDNTSWSLTSQSLGRPLYLNNCRVWSVSCPQGMSGRSLRKLPFLAHAALANPFDCNPIKFLCTMIDTAKRERSELPD